MIREKAEGSGDNDSWCVCLVCGVVCDAFLSFLCFGLCAFFFLLVHVSLLPFFLQKWKWNQNSKIKQQTFSSQKAKKEKHMIRQK
jgi:hypothetical protein